jgi:nitrite transporter NirC
MNDRPYVEKAAHAGARKVSLLQLDPSRYLVRSVGAGMGLTIVVFVFWVLTQNLNDISLGRVIAAGFFGVGLTIIVFTNTELFTSNSMYLTVSSAEGRTTWKQTALLWTACYFGNLAGAILVATLLLGAGSLQLPADHALFTGALHKAHQAGSVIFIKGILANWIVCLAVRMALRCQDEVAKILILILVVFIFVYLGFEHTRSPTWGRSRWQYSEAGRSLSPMLYITCPTARQAMLPVECFLSDCRSLTSIQPNVKSSCAV